MCNYQAEEFPVASSPLPLVAFCRQKKRLADLFVEAAREIISLQHAETQAILGGANLERFDLALRLARQKKDEIKLAYQLHVGKHGC
jgi:hypothetical protein